MLNLKSFAVPALSAVVVSACVVAPYPRQPDHYPGASSPVVVSEIAPPMPYVEVAPVVPFPGALWISGYWGWSGHRHTWVPGRWERPRHGYTWHPHRWEQRGRRWHLHEGGWGRR